MLKFDGGNVKYDKEIIYRELKILNIMERLCFLMSHLELGQVPNCELYQEPYLYSLDMRHVDVYLQIYIHNVFAYLHIYILSHIENMDT